MTKVHAKRNSGQVHIYEISLEEAMGVGTVEINE